MRPPEQPKTAMAPASLTAAIEAVLLVAHEPVSVLKLVEITGADEHLVAKSIGRLKRFYRGRGVVLVKASEGFQLAVAPDMRTCAMEYRSEASFLSDEAVEILALVSYLQPISYAGLVEYKADPSYALETLLLSGIVITTIGVDGDAQYATSESFLESAGLQSLDDLPMIDLGNNNSDDAMPLSDLDAPAVQTSLLHAHKH